jgi:hypothetical protein
MCAVWYIVLLASCKLFPKSMAPQGSWLVCMAILSAAWAKHALCRVPLLRCVGRGFASPSTAPSEQDLESPIPIILASDGGVLGLLYGALLTSSL